jgi:hypothetical protein
MVAYWRAVPSRLAIMRPKIYGRSCISTTDTIEDCVGCVMVAGLWYCKDMGRVWLEGGKWRDVEFEK